MSHQKKEFYKYAFIMMRINKKGDGVQLYDPLQAKSFKEELLYLSYNMEKIIFFLDKELENLSYTADNTSEYQERVTELIKMLDEIKILRDIILIIKEELKKSLFPNLNEEWINHYKRAIIYIEEYTERFKDEIIDEAAFKEWIEEQLIQLKKLH